jgi:hypothetical protein
MAGFWATDGHVLPKAQLMINAGEWTYSCMLSLLAEGYSEFENLDVAACWCRAEGGEVAAT